MAYQSLTQTPPSPLSLDEASPTPAPFGLIVFGITIILLSLHKAGIFHLDTAILGMGIFYGGVLQVIFGITERKKNNPFAAIAFGAYGLFCLSLLALIILPQAGFGESPQPSAMVAYLVMWGLFTAILFIETFHMSRSLQLVFGLLVVFFFLLTSVSATDNPLLRVALGWEGLLCGISAICAGLQLLFSGDSKKRLVPTL